MTLTLAAARQALRRELADTSAPFTFSDADLDAALAVALTALDELAPRPSTLSLVAEGTDQLVLPPGVRRVLAVWHSGWPVRGWTSWGSTLQLAEPVTGAVEIHCWVERVVPAHADDLLPLNSAAEETYLLAAATEQLLRQALLRHARWQGPTGPLEAAVAAAQAAREQAARGLGRVLRVRAW